MAKNRKPKIFYGYIIVAVAFLIMLVFAGALYSFGIFLKPLATEFGWTRATTSGAYSIAMVLMGLLGIVTGRFNDRFGPRLVVAASGFLVGIGYLLMSQISAVWQLYLVYGVIAGAGFSGFFTPLNSTLVRWFVKRRGMMTGILVSGVGIGTIIIPLLANWLISIYDWRNAYIIIGIITLVLIISASQFLKRDPYQIGQLPYGADEITGGSSNLPDQGFSFQEAIRTRQFWLLTMLLVSFGFCLHAVMVHIAPHTTDLGIPAPTAASFLAIIGGASVVGRLIMGAAIDRIGNRPAFIIGFIIMMGTLLWIAVVKDVWMFYLFAVIFGFAYGSMISVESPMTAELFGIREHGVILGAVSAGLPLGGTIGPVLTGGIFDITKSYTPAFLVCAAIALIGLILTLLIRPIGKEAGRKLAPG